MGSNGVEEVTRQVPGVEPVGWVDLDAGARERAVAELGLPEALVFAALPEALRRVPADLALVAVPLAARGEVTRSALAAGLHVLVEKPFTDDLAEAARRWSISPSDRARACS